MSARTKKILNFALIFGTLAIVLIISAGDQDIGAAFRTLGSIKLGWIVACAVCFFSSLLCDAISIWYFLRRQDCKVSLGYVIFVSITGQYYSNITPGASGGQPMQIYYLHKRGVPVGLATSALIVRFFSFQFMLSVLAGAFWLANGPFVAECVGDKMWVLIVGFVYNSVMVAALVLVVINRRLIAWLMRLLIRLGTKVRLIREPETTHEKWMEVLDHFHSSIMLLCRRPLDLLIQLTLGGLQLVLLMSVIYFVYLGLGLREANYGQLLTLDIAEFISAAYTPLPGASGAQEGVFTWYFSRVFTGDLVLPALLTWRFFTYYVSLIVGAITSLIYGFSTGTRIDDTTAVKD